MTSYRPLAAALIVAFACASPAFASFGNPSPEPEVSIEKADVEVERIASNTEMYLDELDRAIDFARKGVYGKLPKGANARLEQARATIGDLLKDDVDPRQLPPDQRIAIFNAHSTIESIINDDDKGRIVCKKEQRLGTRMATTECLTVGERENMARQSAQTSADMLRSTCVADGGKTCTVDH